MLHPHRDSCQAFVCCRIGKTDDPQFDAFAHLTVLNLSVMQIERSLMLYVHVQHINSSLCLFQL